MKKQLKLLVRLIEIEEADGYISFFALLTAVSVYNMTLVTLLNEFLDCILVFNNNKMLRLAKLFTAGQFTITDIQEERELSSCPVRSFYTARK